MAKCNFRRLDHPAYSQVLAPCDFFLFSYLHEKIAGSVYETVEELEEKIRVVIETIPKSRLIAVFSRMAKESGRMYQESRRLLRVNFRSTSSVLGYLFSRSRVRRLNGQPVLSGIQTVAREIAEMLRYCG
jgi:hypothetical protein